MKQGDHSLPMPQGKEKHISSGQKLARERKNVLCPESFQKKLAQSVILFFQRK